MKKGGKSKKTEQAQDLEGVDEITSRKKKSTQSWDEEDENDEVADDNLDQDLETGEEEEEDEVAEKEEEDDDLLDESKLKIDNDLNFEDLDLDDDDDEYYDDDRF